MSNLTLRFRGMLGASAIAISVLTSLAGASPAEAYPFDPNSAHDQYTFTRQIWRGMREGGARSHFGGGAHMGGFMGGFGGPAGFALGGRLF